VPSCSDTGSARTVAYHKCRSSTIADDTNIFITANNISSLNETNSKCKESVRKLFL
jgi:hypothetical protein